MGILETVISKESRQTQNVTYTYIFEEKKTRKDLIKHACKKNKYAVQSYLQK